jgi:predicted TPR repeat methyltransferase
LCAFMRSRPQSFDLVNCADTLVYFGDLSEAIAAARVCLRPEGYFGFTVEATPAECAEPYKIETHGRYGHRTNYVLDVMREAGFEQVEREAVVLRKERGEDVAGHLVIGRSPPISDV